MLLTTKKPLYKLYRNMLKECKSLNITEIKSENIASVITILKTLSSHTITTTCHGQQHSVKNKFSAIIQPY